MNASGLSIAMIIISIAVEVELLFFTLVANGLENEASSLD